MSFYYLQNMCLTNMENNHWIQLQTGLAVAKTDPEKVLHMKLK